MGNPLGKKRAKTIVITKKEITHPFIVDNILDYCEKEKCTHQECILYFIRKGVSNWRKEQSILTTNGLV